MVACRGSTGRCLVVWQDGRAAGTRGLDIFARWIGPDGKPTGSDIRISGTPATADERSPAVACDQQAGRFLTVWEDSRNNSYPAYHGWDVYGRQIGA
jgi:hypothetical protein